MHFDDLSDEFVFRTQHDAAHFAVASDELMGVGAPNLAGSLQQV
jgi:hypothetical protein